MSVLVRHMASAHKKVNVLISIIISIVSIQGSEHKFHFGPFDSVTVYVPQSGVVRNMVLFISGDGGWNLGVIGMTHELVSLQSIVVGIDFRKYERRVRRMSGKCLYLAADFELLSKFVQKKEDLPSYIIPILVGYSSGATLAYAVAAQAPARTFQGAISLGFCPELALVKPLCSGDGGLVSMSGAGGRGILFLPDQNFSTKWIVIQGRADRVCDLSVAERFVKKIPSAQFMPLQNVGHGFGVEKNWLAQFKESFRTIADLEGHRIPDRERPARLAADTEGIVVNDLPLVEVPAHGTAQDRFAIILSGDGGWAGIDKAIAEALADKGIAVVGFNSLQYFWTARTPQETTRDVERVMRYYLNCWNKKGIILIGYSFGADVLPFVGNRLPRTCAEKVDLFAFIGLSSFADFQFTVTDWLGGHHKDALPTLPEIKRLKGRSMLYFYGTEEKETVVDQIDRKTIKTIALRGGHHFGGRYAVIADSIIAGLPE